jgi:hypothetical protein
MKAKTSKPTRTAAARATGSESLLEAPWFIPKKPSNPAQTAQVHVLAHADTARLVRVCYTNGPDGTFVAARANTAGGGNVGTNIYKGACVDLGGTDIELTNPNDVPISGTYAHLPTA